MNTWKQPKIHTQEKEQLNKNTLTEEHKKTDKRVAKNKKKQSRGQA